MTYKKTVIWTDLKIMPGSSKNADTNDEIYTSEKIAEIHDIMDEFEAKAGYIPSRMHFKPFDSEQFQQNDEDAEKTKHKNNSYLAKTLEATIESNIDMEEFCPF